MKISSLLVAPPTVRSLVRATSAAALCSLALAGTSARAASVTLDTTYNGTGKTTTALGLAQDMATAVIVDSSGNIVMAGTGDYAKSGGGYLGGPNFQIERRLSDGSQEGIYNYDFTASDSSIPLAGFQKPTNDHASALIELPGGGCVIGGDTQDPNQSGSEGMNFGLISVDSAAAYVAERSLDFNNNSETITALGNQNVAGTDYVVAAGNVVGSTAESGDFGLARFNTDLSVDITFGGNSDGKYTLDFDGFNDEIKAMLVMPDGKIVVGGLAGYQLVIGGTPTKLNHWALARFNADGTIDNTFGTNGDGKVTLDFGGGNEGIRALALQNGKIVAGGYSSGNFALARFSVDGVLDTTFGTSGKTSFNFEGGSDSIYALTVNESGILALGSEFHPDSGGGGDRDNTNFAIAALTPGGILNTAVPVKGLIKTDHDGANWSDGILAGTFDGAGRLVAAGFTSTADDTNTYDFASERYTVDLVAPDAQKPVVTTTTPTPNEKFSLAAFDANTIGGAATDDVGVIGVTVKLFRDRGGVREIWDGSSFSATPSQKELAATVTGSGASVTWNFDAGIPTPAQLDTGVYYLWVYARDAAKNVGATHSSFTLLSSDLVKPVVTAVAPTSNQQVLISSFTSGSVHGTATDNVGVNHVKVRLSRKRGAVTKFWNGTVFSTTTALVDATYTAGNWVLDTHAPPSGLLDSGPYTLTAYATDVAGNTGVSAAVNFYLSTDFTVPGVSINTPIANQKVDINSFADNTISGAASDNVGVTAVKVKLLRKRGVTVEYWNGTAFQPTSTLISATVSTVGAASVTWNLHNAAPVATDLDAGVYTVYAYAYDAEGNSKISASRSFTITVPASAASSPASVSSAGNS